MTFLRSKPKASSIPRPAARANTIDADKKHVWHPFTQMADWTRDVPSAPLAIASGSGVYLTDTDGKRYIDGVSSLWVTVHGHRKKEIDDAIRCQLGRIAHSTFLGLTHEPAVRLAEELIRIAPQGLTRVFYSDNGSTSVEIALKMAYQYWLQKGNARKKTFVSLVNAYHGDTIGSVSVGGMDLFHGKFRSLLFKPHFAPSPSCYHCRERKNGIPFGVRARDFPAHRAAMGCKGQCLTATEKIFREHHAAVAAMVVEPLVQGAAGMLVEPPGYLKRIEALCRKYDVLLICDEVATGFGRTGKMFACGHEDVRPDFLCLSKGITGGYLPLAATLATEKVYGAFLGRFEEFKTFFHGHTYTANPLACAAALANLAVFRKERVIAGLRRKVRHLRRELAPLLDLPHVGDIRQLGLMVGIELVKDKASRAAFPAGDKTGARVCVAARSRGLIIRPLSDVLVLMPPLSITEREITKAVSAVRGSILEVLPG